MVNPTNIQRTEILVYVDPTCSPIKCHDTFRSVICVLVGFQKIFSLVVLFFSSSLCLLREKDEVSKEESDLAYQLLEDLFPGGQFPNATQVNFKFKKNDNK